MFVVPEFHHRQPGNGWTFPVHMTVHAAWSHILALWTLVGFLSKQGPAQSHETHKGLTVHFDEIECLEVGMYVFGPLQLHCLKLRSHMLFDR